MQSLLIDVNTGFIKHRNGVLAGLESEKYDKVIGELYALNALLPEEYRVTIDTEEYNEKIKNNIQASCNFCTSTVQDSEGKDITKPTTTDYNKLKIMNILLPEFEAFVCGSKYVKVWQCPKCKKDNRLDNTHFEQIVLKQPYFLRVVPEPPQRNLGLVDRPTYKQKFEQWARTLLAELEAEAGRFRKDYKPKSEDNLGEAIMSVEEEED